VLRGLTTQQLEELAYDWQFWGREDQLEPPPIGPSGTPWLTWLILAGRGFGKTRTGAETIRKWATGKTPLAPGQCSRIAIVAETSADARDVLVEGESGILSCHPKDFRPRYEPSKRRLTWPNGAVATTYNATEPDQLRGPQHDAGWCLIAGTTVTMGDGSVKPIETIIAGEYVMTRKGPRRVRASMLTRKSTKVLVLSLADGRTITGTPDHPVWVDGSGFTPLADLVPGARCVELVSNTTVGFGTSGQTGTTRREFVSTDESGRRSEAQFHRASTFITLTAISSTIALTISRCFRMASIVPVISNEISGHTAHALSRTVSRLIDASVSCFLRKISSVRSAAGITAAALAAQQNTALTSVAIGLGRNASAASSALARPADHPISQQGASSDIVPNSVGCGHSMPAQSLRAGRLLAKAAESLSAQLGLTRGSAKEPVPSLGTVEIKSVCPLADTRDVYDLSIDGEREFFANGILVHNCDELAKWAYAEDTWDQLQFGMRLGDRPRKIITTTPRPIPVLKRILALPTTFVTKGSTFDNVANLAESYITEITARYQGTRLGRQELDAELLDDTPGALWTRQLIEQANQMRVDMRGIVPALQRVVVAVDPSGARDINDENADSQGIVIAGKGVDGRAYVLSDWTCKLSPHGWGSRAVQAYRHFAADRIVAERNFGAAMVEHTIRTVDSRVAYREVTASRGKVVRAEPVAALYEQGRVVHLGDPTLDKPGVGTGLESLEDQMCQLTHHGFMGEGSPDRVDALVWALTDLMLEAERPRLAFG
jgi:phage terminase large subunit-like protein